jgi:hypothetical protein
MDETKFNNTLAQLPPAIGETNTTVILLADSCTDPNQQSQQ